MLDEEKIRIMTKLALYEKNIGKEDFHMNEYYRSDYVALNNIKARVSVTIALLLLVGIYGILHFNEILALDGSFNYVNVGIQIGVLYLALMILYTGISTYIYNRKYKKAQRRLVNYNKTLQKLHARVNNGNTVNGI